jgi:hypothetical protein
VATVVSNWSAESMKGHTNLRKEACAQDSFCGNLYVAAIPQELRFDSCSGELRKHTPHNFHLLRQSTAVGRGNRGRTSFARTSIGRTGGVGFEKPTQDKVSDENTCCNLWYTGRLVLRHQRWVFLSFRTSPGSGVVVVDGGSSWHWLIGRCVFDELG